MGIVYIGSFNLGWFVLRIFGSPRGSLAPHVDLRLPSPTDTQRWHAWQGTRLIDEDPREGELGKEVTACATPDDVFLLHVQADGTKHGFHHLTITR